MTLTPSISAARMIAMLFIIACHILQRFSSPLALWFNVGVQIFFVMSGYLYGSRTIDNPLGFIARNLVKILVPCWGLMIGAFIGFHVLGVELPNGMKLVRVLLLADTISGLGHLWFVSNILFCYMMIPLFDSLKRSVKVMTEYHFLLCVSSVVVVIVVIGFAYRPFVRTDGLVCFVIGSYVAAFHEKFGMEQLGARVLEHSLMFIGACAFLSRISYEISPWQGVCGRLYLSVFPYIKAAVGIALFLAMKNYISCSYGFVLRFSDRYSYAIYLTHHVFILGPLSLIGGLWLKNLTIIPVILVSSVLLRELTHPIVVACTKRLN